MAVTKVVWSTAKVKIVLMWKTDRGRGSMSSMKKPNDKPRIEPRELKDSTGWYALVTWGDRPSEQVGGFPNQAEAQKWIDHASAAWVQERLDAENLPRYDRV
jgi:hypothetical protein